MNSYKIQCPYIVPAVLLPPVLCAPVAVTLTREALLLEAFITVVFEFLVKAISDDFAVVATSVIAGCIAFVKWLLARKWSEQTRGRRDSAIDRASYSLIGQHNNEYVRFCACASCSVPASNIVILEKMF